MRFTLCPNTNVHLSAFLTSKHLSKHNPCFLPDFSILSFYLLYLLKALKGELKTAFHSAGCGENREETLLPFWGVYNISRWVEVPSFQWETRMCFFVTPIASLSLQRGLLAVEGRTLPAPRFFIHYFCPKQDEEEHGWIFEALKQR